MNPLPYLAPIFQRRKAIARVPLHRKWASRLIVQNDTQQATLNG
jgi:hypothetical protein